MKRQRERTFKLLQILILILIFMNRWRKKLKPQLIINNPQCYLLSSRHFMIPYRVWTCPLFELKLSCLLQPALQSKDGQNNAMRWRFKRSTWLFWYQRELWWHAPLRQEFCPLSSRFGVILHLSHVPSRPSGIWNDFQGLETLHLEIKSFNYLALKATRWA